MNIEDFRVGNLVYYNGNHKLTGVVTGINRNLVTKDEYLIINYVENIRVVVEDVEPIPLTEEWLCENIEDDEYKYLLDLTLVKNGNNEYSYSNNYGECVYVEYVHQLQNLYYVLRGTDLEIKIKAE